MGKLILVLVIMLGIIAIAQMMRVYELSSQLRNKKEEEISVGDNKFNSTMMLVFCTIFYISFFWLMWTYGDGDIGPSASAQGVELDWLMGVNWTILLIVFFLTNTLLFWFAFKYYHRPDRRAYWYPHNNKLELLWTIVPAVVLAFIIIFGLKTWNDITAYSDKNPVVVEAYSKQFDWTIRYSGPNNKLGRTDFRMLNTDNPLGVVSTVSINKRMDEIRKEVADLTVEHYSDERDRGILKLINPGILKSKHDDVEANYFDTIMIKMDKIDKENTRKMLSPKRIDEIEEKVGRIQRHLMKLISLSKTIKPNHDNWAYDDKVTKELHLVVGKEYEFKFRAQDVIHSAYFPHFRAQMNTVPGMITRFRFTPTITTKDFRAMPETQARMKYINKRRRALGLIPVNEPDLEFDYVLLCNKICGAAHSNMQIKVIVETQEEFDKWYNDKALKTLKDTWMTPAPDQVNTPSDTATTSDAALVPSESGVKQVNENNK